MTRNSRATGVEADLSEPVVAPRSRRQRALARLLFATAVACLIGAFAVFTYKAVPKLTFPFAINYGEGVLLDQMRRVTEAPGLYPSFEEPPYLIDNYPPVYPILARLMPAPDHARFFGGRLLSLLSTLIAAWMIALLVRRWAGETAALLAAATFLSLPEVYRFAYLVRVDALALAFGLTGLYFVLRSHFWLKVAGCVAFFLCIYTRHSMLALPTLGFLLLLGRDGLRSLVWPAGLLTGGVGGYVVLHLLTDGRIYDHLIHFNVLQYSWEQAKYRWFLTLYPWRYPLILAVLLALAPFPPRGRLRLKLSSVAGGMAWIYSAGAVAAIGMVATLFYRSSMRFFFPTQGELPLFGVHRDDLEFMSNVMLSLHIVIAALAVLTVLRAFLRSEKEEDDPSLGLFVLLGFTSAVLIGRVGSDTNYLFEVLALLCLAAGWAVSRGPGVMRIAVTTLLVITVVVNSALVLRPNPDSSPERLRSITVRSERLLTALESVDGPILSEDPQLQPLLKQPLELQVFMYRRLIDAAVWDPARFKERIANKEWGAIVLRWTLASPDVSTKRFAPGQAPSWIPVRDGNVIPLDILYDFIQVYYELDPRTQVLEPITPAYGWRWDLYVPKK